MKYVLGLLWIGLLLGCGSGEPDQREVSPQAQVAPQDSASYIALADSLALQAQKALLATLLEAISQKGFDGAVAFCHANALPITDSVSKAHMTGIRRIASRFRNPLNAPGGFDAEVLGAMAESHAQGIKPTSVFRLTDTAALVYVPIFLGMPVCLGCHGEPEKDIAPSTLAVISEKYPGDQAIGFKTGDLRGAWQISLPIK
jgi:hypothetical protein